MGIYTIADFADTKWVNRITGENACYLDPQYGDDRNDGHPKRPVATPDAAIAIAGTTGKVVIGAGTILGQITAEFHGELIGDAKRPLFDGSAFTFFSGFSTNTFKVINCYLLNYVAIHGTSSQSTRFENCFLEGIVRIGSGTQFGTPFLQFNTFINCFTAGGNDAYINGELNFNKNTLINSIIRLRSDSKIVNCDVDPNSEVQFHTVPILFFDFLNLQGQIDGQTLAAYQAANAGSLPNSINVASGFTNAAIGDYTLLLTSLIRNAANDGLQIGANKVSGSLSGQAPFTNVVNAQWNTDKWEAINGSLPAIIESDVIDLGKSFPISRINLYGNEDDLSNRHFDETLPNDTVNITSGNIVSGEAYLVIDYASVTYDGEIYTAGQVFTGVVGVTTYATSGSGSVFQIIEKPDQRIIKLRGSNTSVADVALQPYKRYIIGHGLIDDSLGVSIGETGHDFADQENPSYQYIQAEIHLLPKSG